MSGWAQQQAEDWQDRCEWEQQQLERIPELDAEIDRLKRLAEDMVQRIKELMNTAEPPFYPHAIEQEIKEWSKKI